MRRALFTIGIFPSRDSYASRRSVIGLAKLEKQTNKKGQSVWVNGAQTSLTHYKTIDAEGGLTSIEAELLNAIRTNQSSIPIRVIDITFGTGKQWSDFLKKHDLELGRDIELHGATFTRDRVVPELKDNVKACLASELHKKFPSNYFDFVVANAGPYHEAKANIENAIHLAKPGGEIMLNHGANLEIPVNDIAEEVGKRSEYSRLRKLRPT